VTVRQDHRGDRLGDCLVGASVMLSFGEETFCGRILASGVPEEIVASLQGEERAVVVLPFSPDEPALAHRVRPTPTVLPRPRERSRTHRVEEVPSASTYAIRVADALERIERGELEKVVLGRGLRVTSTPAWEPDELVARLLDARPGRYVFAVPTPAGTLLGASPELLVRRTGTRLASYPLAGSLPRSQDPVEDAERSALLRTSTKDLTEHRYVVDQIVAALAPVAEVTAAPSVPELLTTDALWHLATPIEAVLDERSAGLSALDVARRLHPTPAMGGVPTDAALTAIAEIERDSRGPLTGAIGWVDADGDGEFALTIRAGVLDGDTFRLFAGAGIVEGSVPRSEVAETGAKLSTMLRIAGVDHAAGISAVGLAGGESAESGTEGAA
jgi:isochorismate synthase